MRKIIIITTLILTMQGFSSCQKQKLQCSNDRERARNRMENRYEEIAREVGRGTYDYDYNNSPKLDSIYANQDYEDRMMLIDSYCK